MVHKIETGNCYFEEIERSTWLMDDHRWALLGWDISCKRRPAILAHLDWHWDGINDFNEREDYKRLLNANSPETLRNLIVENRLIRRDSFISPAIIRGLIDEVHFFCLQDDTQPGLNDQLLHRYQAKEFRHSSLCSLVRAVENRKKPVIADLDLDLFNRATQFYGQGEGLPKKIDYFLSKTNIVFSSADVVTIAKSPGNWWIQEQNQWDWDTGLSEKVAEIIVPRIVLLRSPEFPDYATQRKKVKTKESG